MDILQQLDTLKADYKAATELLEASASEIEGLKAQLSQGTQDAQAAIATLSAKDTEVNRLLAELEAYKGQVATLEAASKTAEEKAVAIVADQGIAPIAIKAEAKAITAQDARNEFASIKDAHERAHYYAKHKALLLGR